MYISEMKKPPRHRIGAVFFTINLTFMITYEKPLSVVSTEFLHNFFFTQAKVKAFINSCAENQQIMLCFLCKRLRKVHSYSLLSCSRISTRRIFPLIVLGSSSVNSITRGYL